MASNQQQQQNLPQFILSGQQIPVTVALEQGLSHTAARPQVLGSDMIVVSQSATFSLDNRGTVSSQPLCTSSSNPWAVITSTTPVLQQPVPSQELQAVRHQNLGTQQIVIQQQSPGTTAGMAIAFPLSTAVGASGGTIHHLGPNPTRVSSHNPMQHTSIVMSSQQTSQSHVNLQGLVTLGNQQHSSSTVMSTVPSLQSSTSTLGASAVAAAAAAATPLLERLAATSFDNTLPGLFNSDLSSPIQSPEKRPRKRLKLAEQLSSNPEVATKRRLICDEKLKDMIKLKDQYREHLTELFFLQNGGNMMDYFVWKKKPTVHLSNFLKSGDLDSDDEEIQDIVGTEDTRYTPVATPVATATTLPPIVSAISQNSSDPSKRQGGRHSIVFGHIQGTATAQLAPQVPGGYPLNTSAATTTVGSPPPYSVSNSFSSTSTSSVVSTMITTVSSIASHSSSTKYSPEVSTINMSQISGVSQSMKSPNMALSPTRQATRQHSISAVYDNQIGTQEAIVERAKQEAQVMQRITELRKEGLWSSRRLPKVQEPPRGKAHWDYLLEEMTWLAADFAQERKWKKAGCRKIARMICKYHQEQHQKEQKAEKEEVLKLKRISGSLAKMVREFWQNIEKVVQYKQTSRLEEKRKKALDLHLSFIVDQTEKYSTWLTEGLGGNSSVCASSTSASPQHSIMEDGDFEPDQSGSDDEETIEKAEQEGGLDEVETKQEVEFLQKESEIPIEELLKSLPKEVLEKPANLSGSESECEGTLAKQKEKSEVDDAFKTSDEDSSDDETTLEEQEHKEKKQDYSQELDDLERECEMSVDELRTKYAAAYDDDFEFESESETENDEEEDSSQEEDEEEIDDLDELEEHDVGIEYLTKILDVECHSQEIEQNIGPSKDITDIAETAMSIQPTGYTLETTKVHTEVPFLLKHQLREYQHVGLDWLATLHERRLNGILADEMGLGKTIQTIAQLAHLACVKGTWGPHLIVVPTSVMLNWEMELKKWCPAFKILTYYGNQKERKQKRTGWTKTNAFHICITSYKLVIQDHQSFRRKKWKYFILDEAQNIKNFKSQRWQTLLNFSSQRRLLLTGTPLQNSLMELWSLMHFLMPHVFQSHKEFKEWFANPLSGMIEGSREYNENLIKRLHKVLRPFLLRRLKQDVEKQMPKKFEHVVKCRLSKRQRFLYDDFMSQTKTKETLESGHFMSVINILMQLRKVCNHPNLFDPRPINSPLQMDGISYKTASVILRALDRDPLQSVDLRHWHPAIVETEIMSTSDCNRINKLQTPSSLIVEIDNQPNVHHQHPTEKFQKQFIFRSFSPLPSMPGRSSPFVPIHHHSDSTLVKSNNLVQQSSQGHTDRSNASSDCVINPKLAKDATQLVVNGPTKTSTPDSSGLSISSNLISTTVLQPTNSVQSAVSASNFVQDSPISTTLSSASYNSDCVTSQPETTLPIKTSASNAHSPLYLESLVEKRASWHEATLNRLSQHNQKYCNVRPVFGSDLHAAVQMMDHLSMTTKTHRWQVHGVVHCCKLKNIQHVEKSGPWNSTQALKDLVHSPEDYLAELKDIITRFVFVIPRVTAPRIRLRTSHPPPSYIQNHRHMKYILHQGLSHEASKLHSIQSRMTVQFPELRLIQYDCGKLQTLDILLRQLKSGSHRVLIFTQMTRMLDIFEQFLNYHGHRYLRLDGTTKVEQRQMLMERFNMDKRIFVFILSTRSGGIGVNLTGADTVIFYDSDWNPTMDAQAQDRCHRIGQTRDVHIYRLICDKTIEENILKKANQKRLLGDVAIEGGNFTTAFFKQNTIKELFDEPSGLESLQKESEENVTTATVSSRRLPAKRAEVTTITPTTPAPKELSDDQMEQALGAAEEDTDIQAAKVVKAEQKAELAEFDESIPWDEKEAEWKREHEEEVSKVEHELSMLDKELMPVERYAVTFTETQMAPLTTEELQKAEEEVVLAKEEWELSRLKHLKEEEERRAELEEDEMLFTYSREDAYNQIYICDDTGERMPMWAPPTPPQDDNDVYIDHTVGFMYEHLPMTENQMPPIYVKKEHKRARIDPAVAAVVRKHKVRKEEQVRVPRSLFDRPLTAKRDLKLLKLKQGLKPLKPQLMPSRPMEQDTLHPEWLIHEDWALLQCVQALQELPLTLQTNSPANVPNWDLVADVVNSSCSRTYRSAKQCKIRYENVVVPREEGKILYDINPRKQKKSKGIYKTKNNRPMRTSQLFCQDSNQSITTLYTLRYDSCKSIAAKRTPAIRPTLANPTLKNPKHQAVLAESGINYEQPLSPLHVARNRAERIAKEKQAAAEQQQLAAQRAQQSQSTTTTVTPTVVGTVSSTSTPSTSAVQIAASVGGTVVAAISQQPMTIVQGQPLTVNTATTGTTVVKTPGVAAVSLPRSLGTGSIVVNTAISAVAGSTFAAINKRMGQAVVGAVAQAPAASTVQAIRAPRPSVAQMTVQEITAAVVNQSQRLTAPGGITTQVISTTTITPAQLVAAQKAGAVAVAAGTVQHSLGQATARTLTPHHIQLLKHQAILKAQAQQAARRISTVQTAGGIIPTQQAAGSVTTVTQTMSGQKTVALTTPLITSVAQAPVSQGARLQVAKPPGLKRALTEAEMALLLKRQHMLQHQKLSGGTVQQVQVTQGQVTRLTSAQILTGTQVQHVGGSSTSASQSVATLVKTVPSQPGSSMPNVTIPVSAVSLSVSVPQQKSLAGKTMAPQVRHLQLQQMQRKTQIQQAQKVATLAGIQQVKGGTTPLIIPQQQQGTLPKVMVQQIQQIVKQQQPQQGLGAPTIQQIITSMPPNQSSSATVIATQLVTQAQPSSVQTVTKMSVPTISSVSTLSQPTRTATPVTVTAVPAPNTVTASGTPQAVTVASVGTSPTVSLTANQATLVKHVHEVHSPQKALSSAQVRTVHQTMRQIPSGLAVSQQPSASVQQAVQQVVQQAQAQAQQRVATAVQQVSQVQTSVTAVPTAATSVVVSVSQAPVIQTPTSSPASQSAAAAAAAVQQLVVTQHQGPQPGDGQAGTGKPSPYTMRLRNQRS